MAPSRIAPLLFSALVCVALAASEADQPPPDPELPPVAYIPYAELEQVDPALEAVFLPYAEFAELWRQRREEGQEPPKPPVDAVLADYQVTGTVGEKAVELAISGTATALGTDWSTLKLSGELAFTQFTAEDPEVSLERGARALQLHLPRPGRYPFSAGSVARVERDVSSERSLTLVLPEAASGSVDLTLPGDDLVVACEPQVPATLSAGDGQTRLRALVGRHRRLTVRWQSEVREQRGPPMLLSQTGIVCAVGARTVHYHCRGTVEILRNAASELAVMLPPEVQVLAVEATDLESWDVVDRRLELRLASPRRGTVELDLSLERNLPVLAAGSERELTLAWPQVVDAARYTGNVVLIAGEGMSLQVRSASGYSQIDPREVGRAGAAAAYRHLARPGPVVLRQTRLQSELRSQLHQWVRLGGEEDRIVAVLDLEVRKAGRFAVDLLVPEAWELLDVTGPAVDEVRRGEAAADGRVRRTVSLAQKLLGQTRLVLRFRAPPSVPRAADAVDSPQHTPGLLQVADARQATGAVLLSAPGSWALTTVAREHLAAATIDAVAAQTPLRSHTTRLDENEVLALAFTFLRQDARLVLELTPRSRELELRQQQRFVISPTQLVGKLVWQGEVRYNALDTLRIAAPSVLDDRLVFKAVDLAEQRVVERDAQQERSVWELRFASPVLGSLQVGARYTTDLPHKLAAGERTQMHLPVIAALGATRSATVLAVARDGSLEVTAEAPALERMEVADLPPAIQGGSAVAAFRGEQPAPVVLSVVRHDLVALADAGVPVVGYRAVIGSDAVARVLGVAELISRGRPYLIVRLPQQASMLEVSVDGRQPRTSQRASGDLVVPLGERTDGRHRVAFVYELPLAPEDIGAVADLTLPLPTISLSDADTRPLTVERTELVVHLPADYRLQRSSGDLARRGGAGFWHQLLFDAPRTNAADTALDARTGLTVQLRPIGRPYRFARLGEGGSVQLAVISESALAWTSLLAALVGLLAGWFARRQCAVLAALFLVVVVGLLGVSGPWLWVVLAFGGGALAALLVALVRGGVGFLRRERPLRRSRRAAAAAEAAAVAVAGGTLADAAVLAQSPQPPETGTGAAQAEAEPDLGDADQATPPDGSAPTDGRQEP